MHTVTQVVKDDWLLDMTRDYFHFATKFFEVISTSATHIYHSALELSPLSSTVRRLYYHQRPTPLPRVVAGAQDSWDQSIVYSNKDYKYESCAWSPCSQFFATRAGNTVEIWDPLTFESLSTLTNSGDHLFGELAYSPDGRSLACLLDTALIIWDIQTGGVAKRTERSTIHSSSLLWSLDGNSIGIMMMWGFGTDTRHCVLDTYCVASGTTRPHGSLRSSGESHFWAHKETFRIMTTTQDGEALTVNIFEAGSTLTNVESFSVQCRGRNVKSFSPTTHRVSMSTRGQLVILDVRNSGRLLNETGEFRSHCFSSDGNLFAASPKGVIRVWQYTSDCYTPWREFPCQDTSDNHPSRRFSLRFSPAFSSILGLFRDVLQVWRLSDRPTTPPYDHRQLAVISHDGTYVATAHKGQRTITITNPLSRTPPHFIDAYRNVQALVLTGSVLLAVCYETIVAWCLTEEGAVDGVICGRRADQSDSVWTIPRPPNYAPELMFAVEGRIGAIKRYSSAPHVYHTGTGEVLQGVQVPSPVDGQLYSLAKVCEGRHHLQYRRLAVYDGRPADDWPLSRTTLQEGWVKDPEGKHRLWLPFEWRTYSDGDWLYEITTLQLKIPGNTGDKRIIAMF